LQDYISLIVEEHKQLKCTWLGFVKDLTQVTTRGMGEQLEGFNL
jgi:hypothetical protein